MDLGCSCSLHFQNVISTPTNTPSFSISWPSLWLAPQDAGSLESGIQEGRGDSLEKMAHLLEARAHLGAGRNFES